MYADTITDSMQRTLDETLRRRQKQVQYNEAHGIIPTQIVKSTEAIMGQTAVADSGARGSRPYIQTDTLSVAADPVYQYMSAGELKKAVSRAEKAMESAVKDMDFLEAARLRDEWLALQQMMKEKEHQ